MSPPLLRYTLDPTGVNPDNYVNAEPHSLEPGLKVRAVAPTYGAFFTESVKIYDGSTNRLLNRGIDYICTELLDLPTEMYAREICYLVIIQNEAVSSNVKISYQALGGPYTRSADAIVNIYNNFQGDQRPVSWPDIINKPTAFPPGPHLHDIGDVYGFEYLTFAVERIRNALLLTDVPGYEKVLTYVTLQIKLLEKTVQSQIDQLAALSDISNLPVATKVTNGTMSAADKTALDNLTKSLTNTTKQYIGLPFKEVPYTNTLTFTPACRGILFCIASIQIGRTSDVSYKHLLRLNDVDIDGDQTTLPMQQFIARTVQPNVLQKIDQVVKAVNDGSVSPCSSISFGFCFIFVPTP